MSIPLVLACHTIAAEPRAISELYKLELIAAEPEIVTPIGMAFDREGRLLVIESHTHQRPEGYKGPESDRIRILSDSDGDGKLDKWTTFAEGFRHAMNLLACDDGGLYVVTRGYIFLLHDTDNDGVADKKQQILRLETEDDYPHNALGGIDRAPNGQLIFGLGENHGMPFRLVGSDGKVFEATGGVDGVFRCAANGRNIEHLARGIWNPFSLCVAPDGRIFTVDNDPDASPPCRLLHIVPGGDYGYLYQYGRAGTHPLQCWNGELPGTLPMVCGVGEGPTGIVPHAGGLWVTSWGDHRIERFDLVPRGASYGATREIVVQGDHEFRPTGIAVAPDGSLYFADWVLRDYSVHGHGRIWRLLLPSEQVARRFPPRSADDLAAQAEPTSMSSDAFVQVQASWKTSQSDDIDKIAHASAGQARFTIPTSMTMNVLQALRWHKPSDAEAVLRANLRDKSDNVRLFAIRWIADERITALRDDVAKLLDGPQPNPRYYLAVLAAVDWLDHEPKMRAKEFTDELLVRELENSKRSVEAHAIALSLLNPDNKFLSKERIRAYLRADFSPLRVEAIRSLAQQSNERRFELLAEVALGDDQLDDVRAEAIVGLSAAADKYQNALQKLAGSDHAVLQREAKRSLRLAGLEPAVAESKPAADDLEAWKKLLDVSGNAVAGRRLFFSPVGARCSVCHTYAGRGGSVGPELTHIGGSTSRERIIASILQPSREIAPDYQPWVLVTTDGKSYTGLLGIRGGVSEREEYIDDAGKTFTLDSSEIESRQASTKSIMPDNLQATLTIDDLRDLVTFLSSTNQPK